MKIIDRLDKYMEISNINDNQITVNCALSVGLLGKARKGDSDLGKKAINKILSFYQDLNMVWLLTGEGDMLKSAHKYANEPNNSVKERLIEYISYKKLSKSDFCRAIGVSTAFVSSMRISIQPDKVKSIALNHPDLNTGWLLTGEGEMLKSAEKHIPTFNGTETVPISVVQFIMEEQKKSGARIDDLIRQNGVLVETVRSQAEIIKKSIVSPSNNVPLEESVKCAAASGSDLEG